MGDRTIELIVTNGWDDAEEARAGRLFVLDKLLSESTGFREWYSTDADYDRFLFDAHDEHGNEYVVAVLNEPSEQIWTRLWTDGFVSVTIDRGMAMRAIPQLPGVV